MTSLRRRNPTDAANNNMGDIQNSLRPASLTLESAVQAHPQQTGEVQKLQISALFLFLPQFLQNWILKISFLSFLRPSWKTRHLVLLGSYLYRFSTHKNSEVKGSPVHVTTVDVHDDAHHALDDSVLLLLARSPSLLPPHHVVFCVSTLRKQYYYACSPDMVPLWINSIRDAKQEAVTRAMGHAHKDAYPSSWAYFDTLGERAQLRKDRIRNRMESSTLRELEMNTFTMGGGGGGIMMADRGYMS